MLISGAPISGLPISAAPAQTTSVLSGSWHDTLTINDVYSNNANLLTGSWSDTLSISDQYLGTLNTLGWSDSLSVTDSFSLLPVTMKSSFADSLIVSDIYVPLSNSIYSGSWSDTLSPSDVFSLQQFTFVIGLPVTVLAQGKQVLSSLGTMAYNDVLLITFNWTKWLLSGDSLVGTPSFNTSLPIASAVLVGTSGPYVTCAVTAGTFTGTGEVSCSVTSAFGEKATRTVAIPVAALVS